MWRPLLAAIVLAISACAQIPKTPQEIFDQKMEPVPGKAVIYIVQNAFGVYDAGLTMDDGTQINTWPGTYYRWVTTPGTHEIQSTEGNLNARITFQVEAGKVYFVQHWVNGVRGSTTDARLQLIGAKAGAEMVTQGRLCCATK